MAVNDYNTDPDLNTSISGINIAEGCAPSGINNAIRQLMADVKAESEAQTAALSAFEAAQASVDTAQDTAIAAAQAAADAAQSSADAAQSSADALNSSKADVSLANLSAAGLEVAANASMPSGRYVDLTLGASGASYTAPASGSLVVYMVPDAAGNGFRVGKGSTSYTSIRTSNKGYAIGNMIPLSKGNVFWVTYDGTPTSAYLRFFYAEGAE